MSKLRSGVATLSAVAVLMGATAFEATAAPSFTVDPSALGSSKAEFEANLINGSASSLLTLDSTTNTVTGSGWIQFSAFVLGSNITANVSGLGSDYDLFATFSYTTSLVSGSLGGVNSDYNVTALTFTLYGDPSFGSIFTAGNATASTAATVSLDGDVSILGTGSLITGVAGFDALGGAYFNSITSFALTDPDGKSFFVDPDPFYDIAFEQFNNTTQGIVRNGNLISINQAAGGVDFNRVPEPASLALLGIGLLGLGASSLRRKMS